MLVQRVYSLALGYEDLNDHEELRNDPLLGMLTGRRDLHTPLAGKSTLNRLELTPAGFPGNRTIQQNQLLRRSTGHPTRRSIYGSAPRRTARDRVGFGCHRHAAARAAGSAVFPRLLRALLLSAAVCVLRSPYLLCARLRPSNIDASAGSLEEVQRIVRQIRGRWPKTRIILRADSGFCREELLAWCENNDVDYVFGFARNKRLRRIIGRAMREAKQEHRRTGKPARELLCQFTYRTKKSWSRARRVIAKAEQIEGKENPRYLVTSLGKEAWSAQKLYEQLYCARGGGSIASRSS